jgi:hypothetical protein
MGKKPTLGEVVELTGPTLGDEVELTIGPPPDPFTSAPLAPQGGGQGLSEPSATQPVQQPVPTGMGGQQPNISDLYATPLTGGITAPQAPSLQRSVGVETLVPPTTQEPTYALPTEQEEAAVDAERGVTSAAIPQGQRFTASDISEAALGTERKEAMYTKRLKDVFGMEPQKDKPAKDTYRELTAYYDDQVADLDAQGLQQFMAQTEQSIQGVKGMASAWKQEMDALEQAARGFEQQVASLPPEEANAQIQAFNAEAQRQAGLLEEKRQTIESLEFAMVRDLQMAALRDYDIKKETGSGLGVAALVGPTGVGKMTSGLTSFIIDGMTALMPAEFVGPEVASGEKTRDQAAKEIKRLMLDDIRKGGAEVTRRALGLDTTEEYYQDAAANGPFMAKAMIGLGESIPAMASPYMSGIFFQTADAIGQELEDEKFDDIPEAEKDLVKVAFGLPAMALERLGFRNLAKNTAVTKAILTKVLGVLPTNATAGQIQRVVDAETRNYLANFGIRMGGAVAAEAETGGAQTAVDLATREVYNALKGRNVLETPETLIDAAYQIAEGAALEAAGAGALGAPVAISAAVRTGKVTKEMTDRQYEMLEGLLSDENYAGTIALYHDELVKSGKMTPEQKTKVEEDLRVATDLASKIPEDLPTDKRKEAFDLLLEKQALSAKDKNLVKGKIIAIDEKLAALAGVKEEAAPEPTTTTTTKEKPKGIPDPDPLEVEWEGEAVAFNAADSEITVESYAKSIISGNRMDGPEAAQFYRDNKDAIEKELSLRRGFPTSTSTNTPPPQQAAETVDEEMTAKSFAEDIAAGKKMDTPEAIQFYENNKDEIEAELQRMVPPTPNEAPAPRPTPTVEAAPPATAAAAAPTPPEPTGRDAGVGEAEMTKGRVGFKTKKLADAFASRMGNWVVRKEGKSWVAIDNSSADFEAESAQLEAESAKEAAAANAEFEARQEAFLKQYPEAEADLMRVEEKIASGTPLTAKEVAIANDNIFRPSGYDFDETGSFVKAKAIEPKTKEQADAIDKAYKSASRFKPSKRVEFGSPITGPSGARLTAYEWKYKFEEYTDSRGEDRVKRVSDWDMAELSDETGRDIVHQFEVVDENGRGSLVSAESALKIMGYLGGTQAKDAKSMMSAAKTLAGYLMQLDGLRAELQIENDAKAKVAKMPRPEVVVKKLDRVSGSIAEEWKMGDAFVWVSYSSDGTLDQEDRAERMKALEEGWKEKEMEKLGIKQYARTEGKIAEIERKIATKERQLGAKATDVSPTAPKPPKGETKETPPKVEKPQEEVKPAAPISDKAKAIADKLRAGKLGGRGLKSTIPGFEQAFDAAIEVAAITIEATGDAAQAISDAIKAFRASDWYKNATKAEREKQETALSDFVADAAADTPPPKKAEPKEDGGESKRVKKTITTERAYEGAFRQEVKDRLREMGLDRDVESFEEAEANAQAIIDAIGLDAALEAVNSNDILGGAGAFIWEAVLNDSERQISQAKDQETLLALYDKQAELVERMNAEYLSIGRRSSALQVVYARGDVGFKASSRISDWKAKTGEAPTDEMIARWREVEKEYEELKKKFAEAEKRREEAKTQQLVDNIGESVAREKAKRTSNTKKFKTVADKFRKLKTKPMVFLDADGNPMNIQQFGMDWNALVELGARAIEKTGELADGVAAIIERIKASDFYKGLDNRNQKAVLEQAQARFEQEYNAINDEDMEVGRIRVPKKMIREAVANGAKDIDSLVEVIREQLKGSYPDATDREIRDAITEYGKVVNLSKDELSQEVRRIKRIGKIVSALEDVAQQKRPLRSGLQRDKLDAEERALNKQLREAMKDLPVDTEARERELKTALDSAKTRMRNRIEDLQREIDTKERVKRNTKSVEADEELKQLIQERDALQAQRDEIFGDKEITEEERLKRTIDATKRRIDEYNKRIKENDLDPAKPSPVKETPELKAIRDGLKAAKEEYRKLQEEAGVIEKKRLDTAKKVANARIEELRRRIDEGDFAQRPKPDRVVDDELVRLNAQKVRLKEEYDKEFYKHKLKNRTQTEIWKDRAWEAWGLTRALQATGELSFVLIQGGAMSISTMWHRPKAVARAFGNMLTAMKSEKRSEEWHSKIKAQDWWPQAKEAKLAITEPHAELTAREELFVSDYTRMFWNALGLPLKLHSDAAYRRWAQANPFRAVERGAAAYLDTLRVERYLDGYEMLQMSGKDVTKEDLKDIANAVNTLTGRASLGPLETSSKLLTKVFFSPRLWASAIKTSTPYAFYHFGKMTPTARKMAIQDMGRYVGTTMAFVALAAMKLNDDDDEETSVETDPRSSDFGKIKIGDTRIDPWGGRAQQVILTSRIIMGALSLLSETAGKGPINAYKKGGQLMPLGMKGRSPGMFDTAMQMVTNKLAPSAALLVEFAKSEVYQTESGEWKRKAPFKDDYSLSKSLMERLYPIYIQTVVELLEEDPGALEGFLIMYAFFGGGVQKYQSSNPVMGLSEPTKQLFDDKGYLIKLPSAGGLKTYDLKIDAERPYTEDERKAFYKRRAEIVDESVKADMDYLKELSREEFIEEMSYINGQATKEAKEDLFLD